MTDNEKLNEKLGAIDYTLRKISNGMGWACLWLFILVVNTCGRK